MLITERWSRSWSFPVYRQSGGTNCTMAIRHQPGGRLTLLSARPVVTFLAAEHRCPLAGTSYTAWWQRHIGVNNLPMVVTQLLPGVGFEPTTCWLQVQRFCATVHYLYVIWCISTKGSAFWVWCWYYSPFCVLKSQKPIWDVYMHFQAKLANIKSCILSKLLHRFQTYFSVINTTKCSSSVVQTYAKKIEDGKSLPCYLMSRQWCDWSSQNFVGWNILTLSTLSAVKFSNKIQDVGHYFENH